MIKYKLSSEFVIFENCTMSKKKSGNCYCNAWYYIQWSHKSQYMEVDELCLAPKMDCMAYEHRS